jgi:hypothetical protein
MPSCHSSAAMPAMDFGDVFVIDGHTFKAKVRHPTMERPLRLS